MAPPPPGFSAGSLSGGLVARVLHVGPYDTVGPVYERLTAWISEHGYLSRGASREVYLSPPDTPPSEIRTIVEWPVAAGPVAGESAAA